jgi:hypothetical protein
MTPDNNVTHMTTRQMRAHLQDYHGIPVVLREQGVSEVVCPYCNKLHVHEPGPGHFVADCDEKDRNTRISVGDRYFVPNYGYLLLEYTAEDSVNKLIY